MPLLFSKGGWSERVEFLIDARKVFTAKKELQGRRRGHGVGKNVNTDGDSFSVQKREKALKTAEVWMGRNSDLN